MAENCRTECPVYQECRARIEFLAKAQREVQDPDNLYYDISVLGFSGEADPFLEAAQGEFAVTQAMRSCNGPRLSARGLAVLIMRTAVVYHPFAGLAAVYSPNIESELRPRYPACTSSGAKAGLVRVPLLDRHFAA